MLPTLFTAGPRRSRERAAFAALAVAILAGLFRDEVIRGDVLGQADVLFEFLPWQTYKPLGWRIHNRMLSDIPTAFYPFLFHARQSILSGEFPLWASAIGAGQPFFASFQSAVLSPFTLLDYLLPFPASFTADVAARLLVGGVGMYLYLRALPLGRGAAAFGGIAFLLNPFSIVWLEHPQSAVAAWVPWLLWSIDRLLRRGDARSIALLAVLTAAALFSGHPETTFKVVLLAAGYAAYRGVATGRVVRSLTLAGTAMLLGALLASVQILPFLEYARDSRILAHRREIGARLTSPPAAFVTAFVPDFYGTPLRNRFVLPGTNYWEQQLYPGIVTWLFAAFSLTDRRHRGRAIFFLVSGALAVLTMYGTVVARIATALIPPLQVAALSRFGLLGIVAVIIAAAIGVQALFGADGAPESPRPRRAAIMALAIAGAVAGIVGVFLWRQHDLLVEGRQWQQTLRAVTHAAVLLTAGLSLVLLRARLDRRAAVALAIALLTVDLFGFADGLHAGMPRQHVFPPLPELAIPQADRGIFRVAGWGDILRPNTGMVYGIQDFRSYDGIGVRTYVELLDVGFQFDGNVHHLVHVATPHLIDLLNIKYVLTSADIDLPNDRFRLLRDGPTRLYLNERVQPRAFLVDSYAVAVGDAARRALRNGLDISRTATLETELPLSLRPERSAGEPGAGRDHPLHRSRGRDQDQGGRPAPAGVVGCLLPRLDGHGRWPGRAGPQGGLCVPRGQRAVR